MKTKKITLSAIMVAMSAVLSLVKVYQLPLGGSITLLSMLPVCAISLCYGVKTGLFASVLYAFVQIALDLAALMGYGMTPLIWVGCLVFDYILAYGILGICGLFRKKGTVGICFGIVLACVARFVSHFISGAIVFDFWCPDGWNVYWYSVVYNGSYMLPELIITIIGAAFLFRVPTIKKLIEERE